MRRGHSEGEGGMDRKIREKRRQSETKRLKRKTRALEENKQMEEKLWRVKTQNFQHKDTKVLVENMCVKNSEIRFDPKQ